MGIDEALDFLEGEFVEEDIKKMSSKDRMNFWISLKEFVKPKIQRTAFETSNDEETEIHIKYKK